MCIYVFPFSSTGFQAEEGSVGRPIGYRDYVDRLLLENLYFIVLTTKKHSSIDEEDVAGMVVCFILFGVVVFAIYSE